MASLWMDPFEDYDDITDLEDGIYAHAGTNWAISSANPATGARSLYLDTDTGGGSDSSINGEHLFRRVFGAAKEVVGCAYRMWVENLPNDGHTVFSGLVSHKLFAFLTEDGSTQIVVVLDTDGSIAIYRDYTWLLNGGGSTFIDRSDPCVVAQSQQHIECKVRIGNAPDGYVEVRVNGVTVLNLTEIDTYANDNPTTSQVVVSPGTVGQIYIDDFHAWDTEEGEGPVNFLGNAAVVKDALIEDTAEADWTLVGAVSAWEALNDTYAGNYIETPTVGHRHRMRIAPMDAEVVAVYAKQINWRMLKTNTGDASVTPALYVDGNEATGPEKAATEQNLMYFAVLATNPDTGAPFEPGDVVDVVFERTL